MFDNVEVDPHELARVAVVAEDVVSDVLHTVHKVRVGVLWTLWGKCDSVTEPADDILGEVPPEMLKVMLDPFVLLIEAEDRRTVQQPGMLAPQDLVGG